MSGQVGTLRRIQSFKDTTGKTSKGQATKVKSVFDMSKEEYIKYLEL